MLFFVEYITIVIEYLSASNHDHADILFFPIMPISIPNTSTEYLKRFLIRFDIGETQIIQYSFQVNSTFGFTINNNYNFLHTFVSIFSYQKTEVELEASFLKMGKPREKPKLSSR